MAGKTVIYTLEASLKDGVTLFSFSPRCVIHLEKGQGPSLSNETNSQRDTTTLTGKLYSALKGKISREKPGAYLATFSITGEIDSNNRFTHAGINSLKVTCIQLKWDKTENDRREADSPRSTLSGASAGASTSSSAHFR